MKSIFLQISLVSILLSFSLYGNSQIAIPMPKCCMKSRALTAADKAKVDRFFEPLSEVKMNLSWCSIGMPNYGLKIRKGLITIVPFGNIEQQVRLLRKNDMYKRSSLIIKIWDN